MLPCCWLQSLYIFFFYYSRPATATRQPVKSLLFKISYISHLCLWFQLPHSINKLTGLILTPFSGSNTLCSVQPITLSFHCGIIGRLVIVMLQPKYLQMYLFFCAKCLAKLCPYIHMNNFPGFTGKKNKRTSICHPNLFLALVLQIKANHFRLALRESWNIIVLIKFAMEKRTVVLLCPFLYDENFTVS